MTIYTHYECRKCGHEIEVEVEINEGDDLPEKCPECGHPTDGADLHADAMAEAADRIHDLTNYD